MERKIIYRRWLYLLSLLGTLTFIFGNSLQPATLSGAESQSVYSFLLDYFPFFTHHLVRKLAHFCEYALLGAHMAFAPLSLSMRDGVGRTVSSLFGALVALLDEGIQLFVPGRAGMLTDALIDYAGYLCGLLLFFFIFFLYAKRKEKRFEKE